MTSLTKVARDLWSEGRNATLTERTVLRDLICAHDHRGTFQNGKSPQWE